MVSMRLCARWMLMGLVVAVCCVLGRFALAQEKKAAVYEKVRFPCLRDDILFSELMARKADALGVGEPGQKVNLTDVQILVYVMPEKGAVVDPSAPLPVKMLITSERGIYETSTSEQGGAQNVATLSGNVLLRRYRAGVLPANLATQKEDLRVQCENASWNQELQMLTGQGAVQVIQPSGMLRGTNFRYRVRRPETKASAKEKPKAPASPKEESVAYGGWLELEKDVSMYFVREDATGTASAKAKDRTDITCLGLARYDMDRREVHFQNKVTVRRQDIQMNSEYLQVMMQKGASPIRELYAWKDVELRGSLPAMGGKGERARFVARGNQARYKAQSEVVALLDQRPGKVPTVEYGTDRISDALLSFDTRRSILYASGGKGHALLRAMVSGKAAQAAPQTGVTDIRYKGSLVYDRTKQYAIFQKSVVLQRGDLGVKADKLLVDMTVDPARPEAHGIHRVVAKQGVVIEQGGRRATAAEAVLDPSTDRLALKGPPNPRVEEPGLSMMEAPVIRMERRGVTRDGRTLNVIEATGPGSGVFLPEGDRKVAEVSVVETDDPASIPEAMTIRYGKSMVYDEARRFARFTEKVVASSRDGVLESQTLDLLIDETNEKTAKGETVIRKRIRRIAAMGSARLHWGNRHCEAERIERDIQRGEIFLHGSPGKQARVYEEGGHAFIAPRIRASLDGTRIHAEGPGELVMENAEAESAGAEGKSSPVRVHYDGSATYQTKAGGAGRVEFHKNVVMSRADMTVQGDTMVAFLQEDKTPGAERVTVDAGAEVSATPRRLRRVEVTGNVRIQRGLRRASGHTATVDVRPSGEVLVLQGALDGVAEVQDLSGIRLRSPQIEVFNNTGIIRSKGPGEVRVLSSEAVPTARWRNEAELRQVEYLLQFIDSMTYNSLARKITFRGNVRMVQEDVQGRCEELILRLSERTDMMADSDNKEGSPPLQVDTIEAFERVRFKRFEPEGYAVPSNTPPEDRPGRTVYTKSEAALYEVKSRIITLRGGPPSPEAIQQTTVYQDEGPKRSRVMLQAEWLKLDVVKGDITGPRPKIRAVSGAGPIRFDE